MLEKCARILNRLTGTRELDLLDIGCCPALARHLNPTIPDLVRTKPSSPSQLVRPRKPTAVVAMGRTEARSQEPSHHPNFGNGGGQVLTPTDVDAEIENPGRSRVAPSSVKAATDCVPMGLL